MPSDAYSRFQASRVMDFEKWHDGIGYDLDALDNLTPEERRAVEAELTSGIAGWRDLEALHRLGTPEAIAAIEDARKSGDIELRLAALRYGSAPDVDMAEGAILEALGSFPVNTLAIELAVSYMTPDIVEALRRCVRECTGTEAYLAAAALLVMHGKLESIHSWNRREFLLRFVEAPSPDRAAAYDELSAEIGVGP